MLKQFCIVFILIVLAFGCENPSNEQKTESVSVVRPTVPAFNNDSAYQFIQQQVDFGPRVPNTPAHKATGDYIIKKLESYGAEVVVQEFTAEAFDGTKLNLRNIIASFNPGFTKRILLAAHWDTRPFADKDTERIDEPIDGANDGGSGVGVLLEIARQFSINEMPRVGVDMIFFDGEDYGMTEDYKVIGAQLNPAETWALGSQYWSKNLHKSNYSAYYGILLDMVGGENARFYREGISMNFAPSIVKKVWDQAHRIGHGSFFVYQNGPPVTDDHVFVNYNAKIPMIDIIEFYPENNFGSYHHTHEDNMEIIDKQTLKAVGETVLHVIYNEDAAKANP